MSDLTKAALEEAFKYKLAPRLERLIPGWAILQQLTPKLSEVEKEGRKYLYPVQLTDEQGVTYGDGTVFAYNDAVAADFDEAEVESNPVVLRTRLSLKAANRMKDNDTAFLNRVGLRTSVMKKSIMKRAEISMLYGQQGIGTLTTVAGSGTTRTWTFSDATWAPGIWSGSINAVLDVYNAAGNTQRNSNADVIVTGVDHANKQITVSGNATDLTAIVATDILWFKGSKTNDMVGIDGIISNTGTLFAIDGSAYDLWSGNSYAVGGQITFTKVMEGLATAVSKGGLDEGACILVPTKRWEKLNSDQAALRDYDSSYKATKAETGFEKITYHGQFGMLDVVAHPYVKEGEAFAFPKSKIRRIGATDTTFLDRNGDYFEVLESAAGYQIVAQHDFSVFIDCPAQCVKYTGITD